MPPLGASAPGGGGKPGGAPADTPGGVNVPKLGGGTTAPRAGAPSGDGGKPGGSASGRALRGGGPAEAICPDPGGEPGPPTGPCVNRASTSLLTCSTRWGN